jgi:hypothetical protein
MGCYTSLPSVSFPTLLHIAPRTNHMYLPEPRCKHQKPPRDFGSHVPSRPVSTTSLPDTNARSSHRNSTSDVNRKSTHIDRLLRDVLTLLLASSAHWSWQATPNQSTPLAYASVLIRPKWITSRRDERCSRSWRQWRRCASWLGNAVTRDLGRSR